MKHISDIKKYERCEKLLWWTKRCPLPFQGFVTYNGNIVELLLKKLNITTYFKGKPYDSNEQFFENEQQHTVFVSTRFEYMGLRIKVPVMIRKAKGYHIYYPYASCYPKESEAQVMADHKWVLSKLGINVVKIKMAHLNSDYCRNGELNLEQLILIQDCLFNERNRPKHKIVDLIKQRSRDLSDTLKQMDEVLKQDTIEKERSNICTRRNKCNYFDKCFEDDGDTSIFHLVSSSQKFDLYHRGIKRIEQLDFSEIEGTRHQFAQYMAAKTGTLFFDKIAVEGFFKDIQYPISYLDFEWETFAYPPYDNMHPYDVLTFQYSLHIEECDGQLKHEEFLGKKDCRETFIIHLLQHLPKKGSIVCYNVEGAEKLRLKQLAEQFPQYADQLEAIWVRMIDLSTPFSSGLIYDNRMAGMYSLKKLVSIFTDYSYDDLEISHGMDAVRSYINLEDNADPKVIESLLKYCAMDTYAMHLIYHWILNQY